MKAPLVLPPFVLRPAAMVVILIVGLLAAVASASQEQQPERLLGGATVEEVARHAVLAPQIIDYEGTKVLSVLRGDEMETVTVNEAHKRPVKTRLDYLSPERVAGRMIVDDGVRLWHYEPRLNMVFRGPSLAMPADAPATWPAQRHRLRLLGLEEVIGRPTVVISVWPKEGRRERRLWIDRTTGVALRTEVRDPEEGLVLTSYFTRISFGLNVPEAFFRPHVPAGARVVTQDGSTRGPLLPLATLQQTVGFPIPALQTIQGYRLLGGEPIQSGPLMAAYLQYSDGARLLAIFVAPANRLGPPGRGEAVAPLGREARTMVIGTMRFVQWEGRGVRLTAVGPLPLSEMVQIARLFPPAR
jgi:outer membrane lipoprotein-sorting protein